ncbi:MAG: SGNH/GDSL hydrolase family protein [Thermoanaerobaculia bacterium]
MVALSTGGTLVAAEMGLRLYYWSKGVGRDDVRELLLRSQHAELRELGKGGGLHGLLRPSAIPDAVYEIKPHLRGTFRGKRLETNAWGLRGPAVKRRKPSGVIRVAGLGDSHMFGWGMPDEACYMAILQRELDAQARPGVRFEVLNFGTPGYNTAMEAAIFEHKALAFAPDFVVLHFVGNDLDPPHFLEPPRPFRPSRWVLVETVRGLFGEVEEEFDTSRLPAAELEGLQRASHESFRHLGGSEELRRALFRIRELAEERQIPTLFMMLGERSRVRRFARAAAVEAGFPVLNPAGYFTRLLAETGREVTPESFRETFSRGDLHPTHLGHRAYARTLRCELAYLGLAGLTARATAGCPPQQTVAPREIGARRKAGGR